MNEQTFLATFREQFEETPAEEIQLDTVYKSLEEWNSMTALVIIAFADDEYAVTLHAEDFTNTSTVLDLYKVIESKK